MDKNIIIEIVKPLVFKIHYKVTKESFEIINYITDWHCKYPEHIETDNECKNIKLVKSWLGLKKGRFSFKKNESVVELQILIINHQHIHLNTTFNALTLCV